MTDPPKKYQSREGQKFSGFVRAHMQVIEAEQDAGITLEAILKEINEQTVFTDVNLNTLKTSLQRARKKVREGGKLPPQAAIPAAAATGEAERQAAPAQPVNQDQGGVKIATVAKKTFDYRPAKAGEGLSHLVGGNTEKGNK
jgi:hypothetical protein